MATVLSDATCDTAHGQSFALHDHDEQSLATYEHDEQSFGAPQHDERPIAAREPNDLGWLGLCGNGEVHTVDGDICHLALICEGDPDTESPDPFLSNEDWRKLVAGCRQG